MKPLTLLLVSFFLSSCMHMIPLGGEDHDGSDTAVIEKEVIAGDIRAIATFPPLVYGKETLFVLKLVDPKTSVPLSGAIVSFHVRYLHVAERTATEDAHAMHHPPSAEKSRRPEEDHEINLDLEVSESSTAGIYSIPFTPRQTGEYNLMFHVNSLRDRRIEPEISFEVRRTVSEATQSHGRGMMGAGNTATYIIAGAVIMSTMMIAMLIAQGRMF